MPSLTKLNVLLDAEHHWIAYAMKEQGSRFYRALGEAIDAADRQNRHLIYQTWTEEIWDFYQRGLILANQQQDKNGS